MLWTLKHLLVTVGMLALGMALLPIVHAGSDRFGVSAPVTMAAAIAAVLVPTIVFTWPIYRLLRLRPLILPLCPHCHKRHANYHIPGNAWPDAVLVCVHCQRPVRLVLSRKAVPDRRSDIPTMALGWPEFLGIWRKV